MFINSNALVSVIISVYNSGKYIRRRLENLLRQSIFEKTEIIIINSGSSDNSESIILEFANKYQNIIYIKTERETIYNAWNRGIRVASGKFITNANSDDLLQYDALEILSNYLQNNPQIALVYGDQYIVSEFNSPIENIKIDKIQKWNNFNYIRLLEASLAGPQPMWRASVHHEDQIWFRDNFHIAGDYEFSCNVGLSYQLKHLPKILGAYYLSPNENNKEYQDKSITFLETYEIKVEYSYKYLNRLDEKEFFRTYKYFKTWVNRSSFWYYFWKYILKIFNPDKRLPTREFAIWFFAFIQEYLGNKLLARKLCHNYLNKYKSLLIERKLSELENSKENNSFITVIIPTYNRPRFLSDALQSLIEQKEKYFEVIIINNGSIDITDVINTFKDKLQIRLIVSNINGSVSHAKNIGIQNAEGDFIAFLDDDDWFHPEHLSTLKSELLKKEYLIAYTDAIVELQDESNGIYKTVKKFVEYSKEFDKQLLLIKDYIFTPCIMLNKKCLNKVGLFDEKLNTDEDMDLLIRLSKFYSFKHIKKVTCSVRRTNAHSALTKNWPLMYKNAEYLFKKHKSLSKFNLFVKVGQFYYLSLRKYRAKKTKYDSINNYY